MDRHTSDANSWDKTMKLNFGGNGRTAPLECDRSTGSRSHFLYLLESREMGSVTPRTVANCASCTCGAIEWSNITDKCVPSRATKLYNLQYSGTDRPFRIVCMVNMQTAPLTSSRTFHYCVNGETLDVTIPEIVDPSYGMYVWPCAAVLAHFVWFHHQQVVGKRILEIGAGTALPSVVAGKCGARVTVSDCDHFPSCLENCRATCLANNLNEVRIIGVTWGQFSADLLELDPIDIILGADCFYDTKDFEDVLVTVSYLMTKNKHCQFWCTYQERSSNRSIEQLLTRWGLTGVQIPLANFDADTANLAESNLSGAHTIHMFIIKKKE